MKKKVDERIRTLIENGVKTRHRSMFVIVGDKSLEQIVNLDYLHRQVDIKSKSNVLWCYKDKLEFSSHWKKRSKQIKKKQQSGLLDPQNVNPFQLFIQTKVITYRKYKDSEKNLGNTFQMCILQDFDALTPNILARIIETVEGGGLIILLLRTLSSLTTLYTMAMRFRTQSHLETKGRFNERFLLSLASCASCIVTDDELNILPISSHIRSIKPVPVQEDCDGLSDSQRGLKMLKDPLVDVDPFGPLIRKCCTLDQGKAVVQFLNAILEKTFRNTYTLLAARGRGKSAALGLSVAGAVSARYSNIFVTAPSPENLKTLFEFVLVGLEALKYEEHNHYNVVTSSNPEFNKATVRIDIFNSGRQTIQYIQPHEHAKLSQVDLLVIDEAAAIPLPVVKSLFGSYTVFLSSTVNGYEGTGRSLSLKLLGHLENSPANGRIYKKVELKESIRYAPCDPVESWLNDLLCLDLASSIPVISRLPPCNECDLYYVNRDTLFSYNKGSELFLQRMMALFVASHYKNSPNDLQLMADAPAHHLFALLGPVDQTKNELPDILCIIQVSLEGEISRESAMKSLREGHQPYGDQIPWKFCEQFQDTVFPGLSGVRIVRIAVHPSAMRLGYGSTAVQLLSRYYEGQLTTISEELDCDVVDKLSSPLRVTEAAEKASLLTENLKPRKDLPPLLVHLSERNPEKLHYIGVSFGLTLDLYRFWCKHKFAPFYISQIANAVTGEHTCMMIKGLLTTNDDVQLSTDFVSPFYEDFRCRFLGLLGSKLKGIEYKLCMSIISSYPPKQKLGGGGSIMTSMDGILSAYDMKRLETYSSNLASYNLILDLVPKLACLYFKRRLEIISLSHTQASILLCMGLKNQDVGDVAKEMGLEHEQILIQFRKIMRKFYSCMSTVSSSNGDQPPRLEKVFPPMTPHSVSVDDDLAAAAKDVENEMKRTTHGHDDGLMNPEVLLKEYAISDDVVDFENAIKTLGGKQPTSSLTSVKSKRNKLEHKHNKGNKKRKSNKGQWLKPCCDP